MMYPVGMGGRRNELSSASSPFSLRRAGCFRGGLTTDSSVTLFLLGSLGSDGNSSLSLLSKAWMIPSNISSTRSLFSSSGSPEDDPSVPEEE